jgi:release factor glutamine methyltransferase
MPASPAERNIGAAMRSKRAARPRGASVGEALRAATEALAAAGVDTPRLDATLLLGSATGIEGARIAAAPDLEMPAGSAREFATMVRRRLRREPVAYILGSKGFRGIEVSVDQRVLIPRPESELLVEVALEFAPGAVLDVGTGSGAVGLAIATELEDSEVTATDTSPAALDLARANARRLGLEDRVRFVAGSVPEGEAFDLAVANLPYVAVGERASLAPEISAWEPAEALFAGADGLEALREVVPRLRCAAAIALEVGAGQAPQVSRLAAQCGFGSLETRSDLSGIERVVVARR